MILSGEVTKLQSFSEFKHRFNVQHSELVDVLEPETVEELLEYENEHREYDGKEPVSDPSEIHEDLLDEEITANKSTNSVIISVLENRTREYVHLYDGYVHTIVKIYPPVPRSNDTDSNRTSEYREEETPTENEKRVMCDGGVKPVHTDTQHQRNGVTLPEYPAEDSNIISRFVPTSRHPAATFEEPNIRNHVLGYMTGRVLNACAGPTKLSEWYTGGEIIRNDLDPGIESDVTMDIAELACHFPANSFDTIVFDPPWSTYQSNLRYNGFMVNKTASDDVPVEQIGIDIRELPFTVPGENVIRESGTGNQMTLTDSFTESKTEYYKKRTVAGDELSTKHEQYIEPDTEKKQLGHARLAKLGFDYLLKPGGTVIQYAYTGSLMPAELEYQRVARTAFDPTGTYKTLIGSVDEKQ